MSPTVSLDNLIFQNLEALQQQTKELRGILDLFVTYWFSDSPESRPVTTIRKLHIAFSVLEHCLVDIQNLSDKQDYQIIAAKLKLIYYLRSFYMMNYARVLVLPRKDSSFYEEPRQRWITITNEWQKYQRKWTQFRRRDNEEVKKGCELIIRICSSSLKGLV